MPLSSIIEDIGAKEVIIIIIKKLLDMENFVFVICIPLQWTDRWFCVDCYRSIRHLQEASTTDGKAAISLAKLKMFQHFYIMVRHLINSCFLPFCICSIRLTCCANYMTRPIYAYKANFHSMCIQNFFTTTVSHTGLYIDKNIDNKSKMSGT